MATEPQENINVQKISLDFNTWLKLIAIVGAAVASFFGMFATSQATMYELDLKWQERITLLAKELKQDIKAVESKIPPDWFRAMVDRNASQIEALESEFTRDFVRKSELDQILKALDKNME